MQQVLSRALKKLASSAGLQILDERVEAVVDADTKAAVNALAASLGGGQRRSVAIRMLLKRGAQGLLEDAAAE